MLENPEERVKKEYKVLKVEFDMGPNSLVDIRAGGPGTLSFWYYTNLPRKDIESVANDEEVQYAVKSHGGSGRFFITEVWAEAFVNNKADLKQRCIKSAKEEF